MSYSILISNFLINRYPDQASHLIYLEKDKHYFLQASATEDKLSATHLSVGVVLPDDQKLFPISKPFLTNVNVEKIPVAGTDKAGGNEFVKTKKDEALMRKLREGRLQCQ